MHDEVTERRLDRLSSTDLLRLLDDEIGVRMTATSPAARRRAADTLVAVVDELESRGIPVSGRTMSTAPGPAAR
ncbi:hypothetical protein ICW40_03545 [Actinotalea ferrariae]|uniref:hypothetical protein n=1 Tax=Actinotalea ferrariae TaxID=1386098 RepID=UPI001C8C34CE|nr:hypothetical protein [Actinotalea ferrariae]MBX9243879.1 hypothetical protein [Actinotalea ferrariae]